MDTPEILAAAELKALHPDRPARVVSAKVARQMLYLLGDNETWSERPSGDELLVWGAIRHAQPELLAELAVFYPEQVEAMKHSLKSWGLDWLRGIVEESWAATGERLDAIAAEADVLLEQCS